MRKPPPKLSPPNLFTESPSTQPKKAIDPARARELQRSYEMMEGIVSQPPPKPKSTSEQKQAQINAHSRALAAAEAQAAAAVAQAQTEAQTAQPQTPPQGSPTPVQTQGTPEKDTQPPAPPSQQPSGKVTPPPKPCGTVFGTHRLKSQYSASAPVPSQPPQNPAPARAHNNTSPAAVEVKPVDPTAQPAENKDGEAQSVDATADTSRDASVSPSADAGVKVEPSIEAVLGEAVANARASGELKNMDSPSSRRHAKAYTFFATAAPRPAPLPGEQLSNCVYCGKEQRATDRFCAGCGHKMQADAPRDAKIS